MEQPIFGPRNNLILILINIEKDNIFHINGNGTAVSRALPYLHGRSIEIMLTAPLREGGSNEIVFRFST